MNKRKMWNLQLFAEDVPDAPEVGDEPDNGGQLDESPKNDTPPEKTYTQADVDKMVREAKSEAERLARMNKEQKEQYEREKLQKDYAALQDKVARMELRGTASNMLSDAKITATPQMLDLLVTASADTTKTNIDTFVAIINDVRKQIETERATGRTPKSYSGSGKEPSVFDQLLNKYK